MSFPASTSANPISADESETNLLPIAPSDGPISGIAIANVILRNRRIIAGMALAFFAVGLVLAVTAPRTYTSTASFAPAQQRSSSNIAGLAAQLGLQSPGNDPSQSPSFYSELIPSREIIDTVAATPIRITRSGATQSITPAAWFGYGGRETPIVRAKVAEAVRKAISVKTSAVSGIVRFAVTTKDAEVSRQLANNTLTAVNEFNARRRGERTENEKEFIESQLAESYGRLADAESKLLSFQLENRAYGTPRLSFEAERLERDVAAKQAIYNSITQSYEQARIDAIRNAPTITVFESPNRPVFPNPRGTISKSITGLVFGALLGMLFAFTREYFSRSRTVYPSAAEEFQMLKRETLADLRFRRRARRSSRR